MTTREHEDDAAVRSIVDLKRHLTELKLEALRRSGDDGPTTDIHDIDAIVEEVETGMRARQARPSIGDSIPPRPEPRISMKR